MGLRPGASKRERSRRFRRRSRTPLPHRSTTTAAERLRSYESARAWAGTLTTKDELFAQPVAGVSEVDATALER